MKPERLDDGTYWYPLNSSTAYTKLDDYEKKLVAVLSNPAVCKVFSLNCDLFSLGDFKVTKDGEEILDDPIIKKLDRPNPFQTGRQWKWDYMFFNMLGCSYMLSGSKLIENDPYIYWLNNSRIDFPEELIAELDKHIMSPKTYDQISDKKITYYYQDGTHKKYALSEILVLPDMTNSLGNWYDSPSRLDALYKVIENSDSALDAKNINLFFSRKFLVAGKQDPENIYDQPLSNPEKQSVERTTLTDKPITAVKSMVDIKRYVDDMAKLKLDDSYTADLITIGNMYNIPKEVLDVMAKGSTYENQEKAIGRHVGYSIQPKGDDLTNGIINYFGYDDKRLEMSITWDHLPFMQVFEKEKADVNKTKSDTLKNLLSLGIDKQSALDYLEMDMEFKTNEDGDN